MNKPLIFLITLFLGFICLTLFSPKAHAFITERKYNRTYKVEDNYLKVNEKKIISVTQPSWFIPEGSTEVFTIFNPVEGDPNSSSKSELTLDSLQVFDQNGTKLPYTLENTPKGNTSVSIKIPRQIRFGDTFTINLSYNSYGLLVKNGAVRDAYIPAFSEDYVFETNSNKESVSTRLLVPKNFGDINFTLPQGNLTANESEHIIDFSQESLVGNTGWVQIGNEQFYTFEIKQDYLKSSDLPLLFNNYKVIIPRDTISGFVTQKVYFTEITPEPSKIEVDKDGNLIAHFKIPAVDSGSISIKGFSSITEGPNLDLRNSGAISDIPEEILDISTKDGRYWEVSSDLIKQTALELKGDETNVYKLVEKTYKYVVNKIDYSEVKRFGINQRQGALKTLQGGAAVCMEYSDLFITLLRAMGIPARGAFGYGYSSLDYESIADGTVNHQWAEFYLPSQNLWVPADTTWGESGELIIGGDLNHFYSHVASVNPEIPSTVEVQFYGAAPRLPERIMNVEIIEQSEFLNLNGLDQNQIIEKYQAEASENQPISEIIDSAMLFWNRSDDLAKVLLVGIIFLFIIVPIFSIIISLIKAITKKLRRKSYAGLNQKVKIESDITEAQPGKI